MIARRVCWTVEETGEVDFFVPPEATWTVCSLSNHRVVSGHVISLLCRTPIPFQMTIIPPFDASFSDKRCIVCLHRCSAGQNNICPDIN